MADSNESTTPETEAKILTRAELNVLDAKEKAAAKWTPELRVIENIVDNFVLQDADVTSAGLGRGKGLGFTGAEVAVIRFDGTKADDGEYRGSSEEHAVKFASTFNSALVQRDSSNRPVGYLTGEDIAKVDGNEVTFNLPELRKLLKNHTIADQLPEISKGYSKQYIMEKSAAQAAQFVEGTIAQRRMERHQQKLHNEVIAQLKEIVEESPEATQQRLQNLTVTNPELAINVQGVFRQMMQIAGASLKNPDILETLADADERAIIERMAETIKERFAENDKAGNQAVKDDAADKAASAGETQRPSGLILPAGVEVPEAANDDKAPAKEEAAPAEKSHAARESKRRAEGGSKEAGIA